MKKLPQNSGETTKKKRGLGKPWPKGVSGNPGGRPKRKVMTEIYLEILTDPEIREQVKKQMIRTMTTKGMAGVLERREAADRTEGKVLDEIQITDLRDLSDEELEARLKALEGDRS